ncbi:broad substrate specificity ATP-binding cassette transporter ABCG2-like isoform X2 [Ptychodera flava]|uniref:broad substrate specificity ATP-binding cassette transporter ABCG2-like isoform X2 n=1 Tax=Ptychodera flava TaxID=63121 RepID=UPI00396A7B05
MISNNNKVKDQDCLVMENLAVGEAPILQKTAHEKEGASYGTSNHVDNGSSSRFGSSTVKGATVSFHNIVYTVRTRIKRKTVKKDILQNVSGVFKSGINAIMGPTGSGKTSLLDILAGRKDPRGLKGQVLINSQKQPHNFKIMSGYVVQDDVVMGTLTVRENLRFSAALRLPKTVKEEERDERVQEVITELGLNSCADSKVGTQFIRGISGGERKRTNIGMELIIQPSVLFLDEPTTGLDASTANAVMLLLYRLARNGRTVILSIHQPRYTIYRLFDTLHLLSLGETVYHGPNDQSLDYFSRLGYVCEEHNNPADFFLDVINGDSSAVLAVKDTLDDAEKGGAFAELDSDKQPDKLGKCFTDSSTNQELSKKLDPIMTTFKETDQPTIKEVGYTSSFSKQLSWLSKRTVLNLLRNPFITVMQMVIMLVFAAVVGTIYWQVDDTLTAGIQNRVGAFFFIIMNMVFGNLSAVELFIQERIIFIHESVSGYYRTSAYFLAKVFCDLIPMRIIPTTIFAAVTYFMIGFQVRADYFFIYLLNLILTAICASSLAFCLSSLVSVAALANLYISLCYVFMMVFSGFLVNLNTIVVWLRWLSYLSIFKYSLDTLSAVELKDLEFCDYVAAPTVPGGNATMAPIAVCEAGTTYLDRQDVDYTDWGIWSNQVALACMSIGFLILTYINLLRIPKLK